MNSFDSHIILSSKVFIANLVFTIPQLFQSQQAPYVHGIRKRFTGLHDNGEEQIGLYRNVGRLIF